MATKYQKNGLINKSTRTVSGAITITIDDSNITTDGSSTVSLPVCSEYNKGFVFTITSTTSDVVTVNPDWTDLINGAAWYTISSPWLSTFRIVDQGEWQVAFASNSPSVAWNDLYKVNNLLVSDINLPSATAMDWDVSTEITTNASLYTLVASWIEVWEDGIYKLVWSIYYEWGTNTQRKSVILRHTINGVAQAELYQSYIRMTGGANETSSSTIGVYSLNSGDVINISGQRGAGWGVCQATAWNSVLVIEKIG